MGAVIIKQIKEFYRDGTMIFVCVFFPVALVFILGQLLGGMMNISDATIGEIKIGYYSQMTEIENGAFEQFILSLEEEGAVLAQGFNNIERAKLSVEKGELSAAIILTDDEVRIIAGSDSVKTRTVKALSDSFLLYKSAYIAAFSNNPTAQAAPTADSYIKVTGGGIAQSATDYYAVAMLVMVLFMSSCIGGSSCYYDEYKLNTINKLAVSPVSPSAVYFGKIIGSLPSVIIQTLSVMLASTFLIGGKYADTFMENLTLAVMFAVVSLAVLSFGVLLNLFFKRLRFSLLSFLFYG